jgi:hypothetical protein
MPPRGLIRGRLPAHARIGDLLIKLGDELIEIGRVLPGGGGLVAEPLRLGASRSRTSGRRWPGRVRCGFVLEVPAFPALRGPQGTDPVRRSAHRTYSAATPIYLEHGESVLPLS